MNIYIYIYIYRRLGVLVQLGNRSVRSCVPCVPCVRSCVCLRDDVASVAGPFFGNSPPGCRRRVPCLVVASRRFPWLLVGFPLLPVASRCFPWLPVASRGFPCAFSLLIFADLCVRAPVPIATLTGPHSHAACSPLIAANQC